MEDALMQMIARGDQESFNELYSLWSRRVMAYAYRSLNDAEEARDVVQETFIQLYRAASTYRAEGKFPAFIFRIAGNLVRMRRRRPHVEVPMPESEDGDEIAPAELTTDPELSLIERIDADMLLASLPPRQRSALVLVAGGVSYAEGAVMMDITPEAFAQLVLRGRRALRAMIKKESDRDG